MPTVVTHDLIRCNRINVTLPSVNNPGLIPFNGGFVRFDNDNLKSYSVKKNVQGRFRHPGIPSEGASIDYSITSMKIGGIEKLTAPTNLTLNYVDSQFTSYPLYTLGNEYLYTNNVANAVVTGTSVLDLGLGINNFYNLVESLINLYSIPVKITKTPELWWSDEGFPRLDNFTLEKHYDVNFEFTCSTDDGSLVTVYRYVFNGQTVSCFINGVDVTVSDPTNLNGNHPQFSDEYSFYSYNYTYDSIEEILACPIFNFFGASLQTDGCSTLEVSCDCKNIKFSDNSNYNDNFLPGHDPELFTTRKIIIKRPSGTTFTLGTSNFTDVDQVIPPHFSSPNVFQYALVDSDEDGIYEVQLCTYPDWSDEVYYNSSTGTIVRRGANLYKAVVSNFDLDPSDPANSNYWQLYTCTGDCDGTRYCTTERVVVICISLLKCYKKLVSEAFCSMESNPCKSMCDNKAFMNAMKFRITMDALEFAVCAGDWISAKKHIDILKSICCCNG